MATNAENQEKYNEAIVQTQKLLVAQSRTIAAQADLLVGMVRSIKDMDFGKLKDQSTDLQKATDGLAKALEDMGDTGEDSFQRMTKEAEKATDQGGLLNDIIEKLQTSQGKLAVAGFGIFEGFTQGLKLSINLTKSLMSLSKTLLGSIMHLGAAIVTAPFKMLRELIAMSATSGDNALATQLEEIRKEFGYLKKESGDAIISMSRSMKGELANTGLSVRRVFGNLVEKLKYFADYAKALGPIFDNIRNSVGEGGAEALGAYNKALGLTNEGMKAVATRALMTGRTVNETNREIANYSLQLSGAFGLTMKQVSRTVGEMMNDFTHFGHLGAKSLTQVAVYARKLGIEIKNLGSVMDKWMNFEDAAQGAAQLSQAFGLNIDALNMMKAQDPAEKIEQLRKAFFRAGKSVETMTYQERRLLASQTGLDDAAVGLAFSLKSQGTSYDQITKKGSAAQRAQLTQAQALQKLSGAIERLVKSGNGINEGFIDTFFHGFGIGIRRSREFRSIMRNLQRSLRATLMAGRQVGRMFVQTFPGVKSFFSGLAGFFEPSKFRNMLGKVKDAFRTFFNQIAGKDPQALPNLLKNLKTGFLDFFDSRSEHGRQFLEGARSLFSSFVLIVNGLFKKAIEGVTKGVRFITDIIAGRESLTALGAQLTQSGGFFGKLINDLIEGIPSLLKSLGEAFVQLWEQLKIRYGARVETGMKGYLSGILGVSLGTAFARGFLAAAGNGALGIAAGLAKMLQRAVTSSSTVARGAGGTLARRVGEGLPSRATKASSSSASEAMRGASEAAQVAERSRATRGSIAKMLVLAAVIAVGMVAVLFAMKNVILWVRENHVGLDEIAKAGLIMGASAGVLAAAAGSVAILMAGMKFSAGSSGGMAASLAALGVVLLAMVGTAGLMVGMVQHFGFTAEAVAKSVVLMGAISAMLISASAIVGISGAIGAVIVATDGLALGAILLGLATLATVVGAMVAGTLSIMEQVNNFKASADFVPKAQVFISMIQAMGTFASNFKDIIQAAAPGIIGTISSTLFGENPQIQMERTLSALSEVVATVGFQIHNLIGVITQQSRDLTPEQITKGRALVEILGAVGDFAKNLQVPTEALTDSSAWFEGSNSVMKLEAINTYINDLAPILRQSMTDIYNLLRDMQSFHFNPNDLAGVTAFGQMMKGSGDLIKNLMPSREILEAVSHSTGGGAAAFRNVSTFMKNVLNDVVGSHLFDSLKSIVESVVNGMSGLTPAQMTIIQRVTPVLEGVVGAIGSVTGLMSGFAGMLKGGSSFLDSGSAAIVSLTLLVSTVFTRLQNFLPETIQKVRDLNLSPRQGQEIRVKMEAVKSVFDTLKLIPEVVKGFSTGSGTTRVADVTNFMNDMNSILSVLFNRTYFQTAIDSVSTFNIPSGFDGKIASISRMFNSLKILTDNSTNVATMSANAQRMAEQVKSNTIGHIAESVKSMVDEVNAVSTQLGNVDVPNINVALRRMAHDIGLGENGQFVVHRGTFNINVNVAVTMDSRDLQTTLVQTARNTNQGPRLGTTNTA